MTRPTEKPSAHAIEQEVLACTNCSGLMPNPPRPVFQFGPRARLLIAGQAPGQRAFVSGKPFDDPSGVRLREWLGLSEREFYDPESVAIVPMGFCFPGHDAKGGDLPPMKVCAQIWRERVLSELQQIETTVLVGGYSQRYHLPEAKGTSLTALVEDWRRFAPKYFVTPHPSWRNNAWLKKNPWFEAECLPELRARVRGLLRSS